MFNMSIKFFKKLKKYFKIIKTNGKEKKIKKLTIDRIMQNKDKDVIIITKNSSNKYGLYIIK